VSNLPKVSSLYATIFLFVCFFLYQYGLSYHLSFGSIGLFLLVLISYKYKTEVGINLSFIIPLLILICFTMHVYNYGESEYLARILRYCFTAWALFFILNSSCTIPPPPEKFLLAAVIILLFIAGYQNFVDPFAKAPNQLMALKTEYLDIELAREVFDAEINGKLRASGLYTEPSVLALVSCCILFIALASADKLKNVIIWLVLLVVFLSGSLLGYIGVTMLLFLVYRSEIFRSEKVMLLFVFAVPIAIFSLFFMLAERSAGGGELLDGSSMVRLVYPFIIINENFKNFDFLGYCGDIYTHFLSLNLYDSMGNYPGHNGFLSLIQAFGIFGVVMILILFNRLRHLMEYVIIFLIGSQSGNFFSYEKVYLMAYMVLVYRYNFKFKLTTLNDFR